MKTIIVPTDYSPAAANAVNYAADMALALKADLLLVHIFQIPVSVADVPLALVSVEDMQKTEDEKIASLEADVEHITSGKINITTDARMGSVVDEMEDICN